MSGERSDFFLGHAGADRAWTKWRLMDAGYTVELDMRDWAVGRNFITAISDALERCDQVVALLCTACFGRSRLHHRGIVARLCVEVGT